jgi:hypothetical protein
MTRRTYVYDAEMDCMIMIRGPGVNHPEVVPHGLTIIRDIEPYRTAASDVASDGKRPVIGSRSRHRTFLRDNSYVEVGNERPISGERPTMSREERVNDIRRAMGDFGSNTGSRGN